MNLSRVIRAASSLALLVALLLGLAPLPAAAAPGTVELVVGLREGSRSLSLSHLHSRAGAVETDRLDKFGFRVVRTSDPVRAGRVYSQDPAVRFVEENRIRHAFTNDPGVPQQYSVSRTELDSAWELTPGDQSPIAILDTGIDLDHEDLGGKIIASFNAVSLLASADDDHFHGTHVAGIAAAITDNGKGIAGVARTNPLFAVKVLRSDGTGTDSAIAKGIQWAVDNGARVINLSLGALGSSNTLAEGVAYALDRDVVVVAAAGNTSGSSCPHGPVNYPAAYEGVIAVSSTNANDDLSCFSNIGPEVSVAAPGENILSTLPNNSYGYMSGTSMASPLVAGLASLVRSRDPEMSRHDVKRVIEEMSYDLGRVGHDERFGHGRVRAHKAVGAAKSWFSDVPRAALFSSHINFFRQTEVVSGFGDGTFGPSDSVTRAAATKMAVGAFGLPLYTGTEQTFSDTPPSHGLYRYVETLARAGIVRGIGGGLFGPDKPVKRGDLCIIAVRTAESRRGWAIDTAGGPHFSDVPSSHYAYQFVETLYLHGAITGVKAPVIEPVTGVLVEPGVFGVDDLVTRSAATKIFFSSSYQP